MCGRFTIAIEPAEFMQEFGLSDMPADWLIRYNVAPSQNIPVIRDHARREIDYLKWGLVPGWAKDPAIGNKLINARAETILEKPSFRNSFFRRRCLILADGFYEWRKDPLANVPSQPFRFTRKDHKPLAFAGLWDLWKSPQNIDICSATIVTCTANAVVQPVHDRMPVVLQPGSYWNWLQLREQQDLLDLLRPAPDDMLTGYPVSRLINRPEIDSPECIEKLGSGSLSAADSV